MIQYDDDLTGVLNPDFLAIGLGGTNMMAMLWTVAMGKRAVGVEMRGDPFLGVHWNIRADFYHQLGLIETIGNIREVSRPQGGLAGLGPQPQLRDVGSRRHAQPDGGSAGSQYRLE